MVSVVWVVCEDDVMTTCAEAGSLAKTVVRELVLGSTTVSPIE